MEKHGRRVTSLGRVDRLVFASYPPTPSLYAVVARHANSSSLYGLAHSYGCQPDPTTGTQAVLPFVIGYDLNRIFCGAVN